MASSEAEEKARKKATKKEKKQKKKEKKERKRQKLGEAEEDVVKDVVVETEEKDDTQEKDSEVKEVTKETLPETPQEDADADDAAEENPEGGTKRKRKRKRKRKAAAEEAEEEPIVENANPTDLTQHTVFVEGIPFDASVENVREFFAANIEENDILELRLPTWQDTGRLRGFGHVRLSGMEAYEKALSLNGKYMGKRYLNVQPSKESSGGSGSRSNTLSLPVPDGCLTLFVNNLPYGATETDIAQAFSKKLAGNASLTEEHVRIARNSVTRQSKGFCYIDFDTARDLEAIVKASQQRPVVVGGRQVRLDYDTNGRIKGSFRTDSGRLYNKEQTEKKRALR